MTKKRRAPFVRPHHLRAHFEYDVPYHRYTWRRELRYAVAAAGRANARLEPRFVPVVADDRESPSRGDVAIEVEVDGAVVRISRTAEVRQITAVVQALRPMR